MNREGDLSKISDHPENFRTPTTIIPPLSDFLFTFLSSFFTSLPFLPYPVPDRVETVRDHGTYP